MQHFNPIQTKWVVAAGMRRVRLLKQSIPFGVAVLYTLAQIFLQFIALKARKKSSLHTIMLEKQTQTKHLIALIFFEYSFPCKRIRYIKPIVINTHIDY